MSTDRQAQGFRAFLRVLRNRNFFWLWVSQLISFTGDFFSFLAVPYFITLLAQGGEAAAAVAAGSELPAEAKTLTGAAMIAATLPRLLGIFTGVFVDRWDYRRTMIVANTFAGLVVLLPLLVFSLDGAWLLIAMQFLLALVGRFIYPTQNAAVRQIFDDENDLLAANGLMMSSLTVGSIIGPLVAGVVVQQFGAKAAFLFDGASFVIAAAIIGLLLRLPRPTYRPTGEGVRVIAGQIWAGMRHIFVTRLLLATVICFALMQAGISGVNAMWGALHARDVRPGAAGDLAGGYRPGNRDGGRHAGARPDDGAAEQIRHRGPDAAGSRHRGRQLRRRAGLWRGVGCQRLDRCADRAEPVGHEHADAALDPQGDAGTGDEFVPCHYPGRQRHGHERDHHAGDGDPAAADLRRCRAGNRRDERRLGVVGARRRAGAGKALCRRNGRTASCDHRRLMRKCGKKPAAYVFRADRQGFKPLAKSAKSAEAD